MARNLSAPKSVAQTPKIFISKMENFDSEQIDAVLERLQTEHPFLTPMYVEVIRYYSNPLSPHKGTVVDENHEHPCYPYDFDAVHFLKEYPDGIVFNIEE